jgi:hypothetical protein
MHDFLSQFLKLDQRWRGHLELAIEHMLASAAQLQSEILAVLSRSASIPSDLSGEAMVLALALHLFLLMRPIEIIDEILLELSEEELFDECSPVSALLK